MKGGLVIAGSFVGVLLCGRDLCHRAVGAAKLERAILDEENSGACDVVCRRRSRIRDHDGTFAATKIAVINVPY